MTTAGNDISGLLFLLSSNEIAIKVQAINDLAKTGSIDAYEPLKNLLRQKNLPVKSIVKQALATLEGEIKKRNAAVYEKLVKDRDEAAGEGRHSSINYEVLAQYLQDEELKNRIAVISACGKYGRDEKVEALLVEQLSKESHPFAIATIVINLGRCGSPTVRDVIADFLKNPDERVRANAVEGLENLDDPSVIEVLIPLINDPAPRVKANVAKALCHFEPELVKNTLISMLESGDEDAAEAAKFAQEAMKLKLREEQKKPKTGGKAAGAQGVADLSSPPPGTAGEARSSAPPPPPKPPVEPEKEGTNAKLAVAIAAVAVIALSAIGYLAWNQAPPKQAGETPAAQNAGYDAYEVQLASKFKALLAEFEKQISAKQTTDASFTLGRMRQLRPGEPLLKTLEGEIKMAADNLRDAMAIFKDAMRVDGQNPRLHYDVALCYMGLGNTEEAARFFAEAIKYDRDGAYKDKARKAADDIKARSDREIAEARTEAEKFFGAYYSVVNAEGPRAVKQYYNNTSDYEKFERAFRATLLETKRWQISHAPVSFDVTKSRERGRVISAKVVEAWHYTAFGGFSWMSFFYRDFSFVDAPQGHAFDPGIPPVTILVNTLEDDRNAIEKTSKDEAQHEHAIALAAAQRPDTPTTLAVELLRRTLKKDPSSIMAALELLNRRAELDTTEVESVIKTFEKVSHSSYSQKFVFGNGFLRATMLDMAANVHLSAGRDGEFVKTLSSLTAELPEYAQAWFELAIHYSGAGKKAEFEAAFGKAIAAEPEFPAFESYFFNRAFEENASLMKTPDLDVNLELVMRLEKIIAIKPDYWRTYYNVGKILLVLNKNQAAEEFFQRALARSPGNCNVLARLAFCRIRQKDLAKAREYNTAAEKADPYNFQVRRNRAALSK